MKITKELWDKYAASNAKRRKRSKTLAAIHAHVVPIRRERLSRKGRDMLGFFSPAFKLQRKRAIEKFNRQLAELEKEKQDARDIRKTLQHAGRVARSMGFIVEPSKDRRGRISSYYARREYFAKPIRISDHELPTTGRREFMAEVYGGSPYAAEIIIDEPMTETRLRRLLTLAQAGRI